jgi:hypothetical protein
MFAFPTTLTNDRMLMLEIKEADIGEVEDSHHSIGCIDAYFLRAIVAGDIAHPAAMMWQPAHSPPHVVGPETSDPAFGHI